MNHRVGEGMSDTNRPTYSCAMDNASDYEQANIESVYRVCNNSHKSMKKDNSKK
jgi:hypothetical protein